VSIGPKTTLSLYSKTDVADGMGGYTRTWAETKSSVVGTLSTLTARERMMYGKKAEAADYIFVTDHMFGGSYDSMDQFRSGTRVLDIEGVENPMNQNRFTIFFLSEKKNG
jgi:hypothetical protein